MLKVKKILINDPLYQQERELRNRVLLRPIGLPDFGWEMRDNDSHHIVAIQDDEVVGCVILYPLPDQPGQAQLMQMAVDSNLQRQGIGKLLIDKLFEVARSNEISEIQCHAQHTAVEFYKRKNFEVEGNEFFEAGIKHFHMRAVVPKLVPFT